MGYEDRYADRQAVEQAAIRLSHTPINEGDENAIAFSKSKRSKRR